MNDNAAAGRRGTNDANMAAPARATASMYSGEAVMATVIIFLEALVDGLSITYKSNKLDR
jgi:hypothetical protein